VDDSSRAFALAERWLGLGRRWDDFLLLDLGFGLGMGIFLGGAPYTGSACRSGEIGHMVVAPDGEPCACGNRGCLETVASGRAIARQAREAIVAGSAPLLRDLTHDRPHDVTAQDVGVAASMGDAFSIGLLEAAGRAIGLALANAVTLLNPPAVILGGGLVAAGRVLTDAISDTLRRYAMPGLREDLRLEVSGLGADGSALGIALAAAGLVLEGA
jgi:predicted NBD/HSP70 family sugar kinase